MQEVAVLENAWLRVEGDKIAAIGTMDSLSNATLSSFGQSAQGNQVIDCSGRIVFPGFVDSHTHLIFAKTRQGEFVNRIRGLSYAEIAAKGGGILNSARRLQETDEEVLLQDAIARAWEVLRLGTTTLEIKSGYGLTVKDEIKMLRVARDLQKFTPQRIKTTLLGAHAFPLEYKDNHAGYIDLIVREMIPRVAEEGLAQYIDVFCEQGFFSVADTERILIAGAEYGLKPKIHANQLHASGGVQVGVKHHAVSVDHLEVMGQAEIDCLLHSKTIPTLLPSAAFFLGVGYQPARKMIDAGLGVAIASDYNPGSTPTGNMAFEMALACTQMKMLPEEALTACTLNGAAALEVAHETGSIEVGKAADLIISQPMEELSLIPYFFANNQIGKVVIAGIPY